MKVYTSYFYQIRNFKSNMIPISTAAFDPKWFHNNSGDKYNFVDKRGVVNGIKLKEFAPNSSLHCYCSKDCPHKEEQEDCEFLTKYYEQISKYPIENVMHWIECVCKSAKEQLGLEEEPIPVLIVFEKPDTKCSERNKIQEYFNSRGIECEELHYPIA